MPCPNCKATVAAAAKFCTNCGTKINQPTSTPAPTTTTTKPPATQSTKPTSSGGTTFCNVCGEPIIGKSCRTCDATASITSAPVPTTNNQSRPVSGSFKAVTVTPTSGQKKCPKCGALSSLKVCSSCGEKLDQSSTPTVSSTTTSNGNKSRPPSTSMPAPVKTTTVTPASPSKPVDTPTSSTNSTTTSKPTTTTTPTRATISTPSTSASTSSSEKKCPKCSTLNTTKFCTACGCKIDEPVTSTTTTPAASKPKEEVMKPPPPPAKQSVPPPPPKQTAPPAAQPVQTPPPPPPKQTTPPPPPAKQAIPPPPPKQTVPPPPPPKQSGVPVRGPGQGIPPPPPPKNTVPPPPPAKKAIPPPPSTPKPPPIEEDPRMKAILEENERLKKQVESLQYKEAQNQPSPTTSQSSYDYTPTSAPAAQTTPAPAENPAEPAAERSWKKKLNQSRVLRESGETAPQRPESFNEEVSEDSASKHKSAERSWKTKTRTSNAGEQKKPNPMGSVRHRRVTDLSLPPRERVVCEILETEMDYVADLETIVNIFLNPLRKEQIASPEDLIGIFSNVEFILIVNQQLRDELQQNGGKNIGQTFLKKKDYLRVYATYCSNQQTSMDITQRLLKKDKDKKLESFLQYTYARPECQNLDFNSFMIKPIQRICKYPLLMKELLKQTDPSHEEYQQTKDALQALEDLLSQINEKKRDAESVQKVIELTKVLVGAEGHKLVEPTRRYIKEGELSFYKSNKKEKEKKEKEGYFFLFNDVFILAKKKGSKFKMIAFISLKTADIRLAVTYEKPCFELINTADNTVWPLIMSSQDLLIAFMGEVQTLIEKEQSRGSLRQSVKTQKLDDTITFECEYTEKKTVQMNRNSFTYEDLYYAIADQFGVQAITIMYGTYYIGSQQDVDSILAEGKSQYNLLIYDYYDYSQSNGNEEGQYQQ